MEHSDRQESLWLVPMYGATGTARVEAQLPPVYFLNVDPSQTSISRLMSKICMLTPVPQEEDWDSPLLGRSVSADRCVKEHPLGGRCETTMRSTGGGVDAAVEEMGGR